MKTTGLQKPGESRTEAIRMGHDMTAWVFVGKTVDKHYEVVDLTRTTCQRPGCDARLVIAGNRGLLDTSAITYPCEGEGSPQGADKQPRKPTISEVKRKMQLAHYDRVGRKGERDALSRANRQAKAKAGDTVDVNPDTKDPDTKDTDKESHDPVDH